MFSPLTISPSIFVNYKLYSNLKYSVFWDRVSFQTSISGLRISAREKIEITYLFTGCPWVNLRDFGRQGCYILDNFEIL